MKLVNLGVFTTPDGQSFELLEKVNFIQYGRDIFEGTKSYETSCGRHVNLKDGIFSLLDD
tara:strand:+ start:1101 stop:1280 length:180 start_codon:yes stop_codon:yes gene_type:complete